MGAGAANMALTPNPPMCYFQMCQICVLSSCVQRRGTEKLLDTIVFEKCNEINIRFVVCLLLLKQSRHTGVGVHDTYTFLLSLYMTKPVNFSDLILTCDGLVPLIVMDYTGFLPNVSPLIYVF